MKTLFNIYPFTRIRVYIMEYRAAYTTCLALTFADDIVSEMWGWTYFN